MWGELFNFLAQFLPLHIPPLTNRNLCNELIWKWVHQVLFCSSESVSFVKPHNHLTNYAAATAYFHLFYFMPGLSPYRFRMLNPHQHHMWMVKDRSRKHCLWAGSTIPNFHAMFFRPIRVWYLWWICEKFYIFPHATLNFIVAGSVWRRCSGGRRIKMVKKGKL